MYPFVEGKYRFKWGMAFTTRVSFDFGGEMEIDRVYGDANRPLIAVLPAAWHESTRAMGDMAAPCGQRFVGWDAFVANAYQKHMRQKRSAREYGYFNYGDWFGERGRNWGNNEYDLAHGFFMQFVRTGNRDDFRLALDRRSPSG